MPPPPPPSKSYLLVLDTDSEDDDDDDDNHDDDVADGYHNNHHDFHADSTITTATATAPTTKETLFEIKKSEQNSVHSKNASSLVDSFQNTALLGPPSTPELVNEKDHHNNNNDDDDDDDDDQSRNSSSSSESRRSCSPTTSSTATTTTASTIASPSKKTKRKRAKKKKKRNRHKKKSSNTATSSTGPAQVVTKNSNNHKHKHNSNRVSFGSVDLRLYERSLGGDGVPSDGGWPLCLTSTVLEESHIPIDDFEVYRRSVLQDRLQELQRDQSASSLSSSLLSSARLIQPLILETRQWDYKKERDTQGHSIRNPLFSPLDEDERQQLLVTGKAPKLSTLTSSSSSSGSSSSSSSLSSAHAHGTRARSRSISIDATWDCPFDPVDVRHIRNELEDLRVERSKEQGCTCRKFQVYGKKNRTSISKLNAELKKRNQLPTKTCTRDELEHLLYTLIETEPCCSNQFHNNNSCPCVQNGVGCQADACSCWRTTNSSNSSNSSSSSSSSSHSTKNNNNNKDQSTTTTSSSSSRDIPTSVIQLQQRCGNIHGMYVVDLKSISNVRKQIIAQYKDKKNNNINEDGGVGVEENNDNMYCQVIPETPVA